MKAPGRQVIVPAGLALALLSIGRTTLAARDYWRSYKEGSLRMSTGGQARVLAREKGFRCTGSGMSLDIAVELRSQPVSHSRREIFRQRTMQMSAVDTSPRLWSVWRMHYPIWLETLFPYEIFLEHRADFISTGPFPVRRRRLSFYQ